MENTSINVTGTYHQDCGALVSHYQTLHSHYMTENDEEKKDIIDGQMRTILNEMHSMNCGQTHNSASFTGGTCGMGADSLTTPIMLFSGGGTNNTFAAPNSSTDAFGGRTNKVWGNPSDALCGVCSVVDMVRVPNGAWGTLMPIVPISNDVQLPVCSTKNEDAISDATTDKKESVAYVKPSFLQWLLNGMKA